MKKIILILIVAITTSNVVQAQCQLNNCIGKISLIYVHTNTNVYVKVNQDMTGITSCVLDSNGLILPKNHTMQQEIYSLLLSAKLADADVKIRAVDGSDKCSIAYVQLLP
jgi:hypothetical protein